MKRFLATFALLALALGGFAQLSVYPAPGAVRLAVPQNDDFTVRVRQPGGEWLELYEYTVVVDMDRPQPASMVQFDMGSPVEVFVRKNNGNFSEVKIRPAGRGVEFRREMDAIVFTLEKPQYLSVEFDGDRLHNLHLFANPLEAEVPEKGAPGVIWFDEGVHRPAEGHSFFDIPSNTTVYLAPGAILTGMLRADSVENVRILGRGIIYHAQRGIEVTHSRNVTIDGVTVINPDHYTLCGGQSRGLTVRNLKAFSSKGWSDGIDMMSTSDVLLDNLFMRNSDDCITVYGHRWNYWGGVENVVVQNSVLWADIAHPINIGSHGDDTGTPGDTLRNLVFRNIDILEHDEDDLPYQGCMAINCGDRNFITDVLFEDIRVDNFQEGRLFHFQVMFNEKYNKAAGRGIRNVTLRNITYNGVGAARPLIWGYDSQRTVDGVNFENIVINGRRLTSLRELEINENEFVRNIQLK